MPIESRAFKGTPETAAHYQPFITPASVCKRGIFLGINMRTRAPEFFDPWWLKFNGVINGCVFHLEGAREGGKSTTMKALSMRLPALQGAYIDDQPEHIRTRINDRKPEDGQSEYAPVTEFLGSKIVQLNNMASFNIFDPEMGMNHFDIIETAINVCEMVRQAPLPTMEVTAIMVGVHSMLSNKWSLVSPETLEYLIRVQTLAEAEAYFESANTEFTTFMEQARQERSETLPDLQAETHNLDAHEFAAASANVASYLGRLLRGDYGGIIGGNRSLSEVLTAPTLTLDWTGVNDQATTIMQAMLWKWQRIALSTNRKQLIPHLVFSDENAEAMNNLMYVRAQAEYSMKARAFHTADFTAVQYRSSIAEAGAEGSQIRALAKTILLGVGARFLFRQSADDETMQQNISSGISEQDAYKLTQLGTGQVGIKYPDRPLQFVQILLAPSEIPLVKSNSATEGMANRRSVYENETVKARMEQLRERAEMEGATANA